MIQVYHLSIFFSISSVYIEETTCNEALTGENVRHAKKGEFPFVVSLSLNIPDVEDIANPIENHFCGGALITKKHVLTAAHCFDLFPHTQHVVVKTNHGDLLESQIHTVKQWTLYHEWMKNDNIDKVINDIAIVELHEKVGTHIKPVRITCHPEAYFYGKTVAIAGWGINNNNENSRHLLVSDDLVVLDLNKCQRNLEEDVLAQMTNLNGSLFMCTQAEPPIHTELGDSGDPVFLPHSHEIIAVHTGLCATVRHGKFVYRENVHVSIDHYRQFIAHVIQCKESNCCAT